MFDPSKRLFPCMVLPGDPHRTQGIPHLISLATSAVLSLTMWRLHLSLWGLSSALIASGIAYTLFGQARANHVATFVKTYRFHAGHDVSDEIIPHLGPRWLALAVCISLSFGVVTIVRPVFIYLSLGLWFWRVWRRSKLAPPTIINEYWQQTLTFLAYPDSRYAAPAGMAAMWIPASSMFQRQCHIALLFFPFYLALWSGFISGVYLGCQTPPKALADALLLIPVPFLALAAMSVHGIESLRRPI